MKKNIFKGLILVIAMISAGITANAIKPTHKIADDRPKVQLTEVIPTQFDDWRNIPFTSAVVANPQAQSLLDQLYAQILTRTYVNSHGQSIMLSIAYGEDQRDGMQAHHPEICYPAQGFQVNSIQTSQITTPYGTVPVKRLETQLNEQRIEPVTYWLTVGDEATLGGVNKKLIEMRYGLHGRIPDGLLFRISSIDHDAAGAFLLQEKFARELLTAVTPELRSRLAGLHN